MPRITKAPLTIATMSRPDVDAIRVRCHRMRTCGSLDLLIVDSIDELAAVRPGKLEEVVRSLERVARAAAGDCRHPLPRLTHVCRHTNGQRARFGPPSTWVPDYAPDRAVLTSV